MAFLHNTRWLPRCTIATALGSLAENEVTYAMIPFIEGRASPYSVLHEAPSMSQPRELIRDRNQVVVVDCLDHAVPVVVHRHRIHCTENPASDRRDGVTIAANVGGEEDGLLRRLHHRGEPQGQWHDGHRPIRKARRC